MKFARVSLWVGFMALFASCRQSPSGPPVLDRQQYTFAGATRCDTTHNRGVDVSATYFLLRDNSEGAGKINDSLRRLVAGSIVGWLDSATIVQHPDAQTNLAKAASLFAADYESTLNDLGGLEGCWELKTTADTVHANSKTLTVRVETYAYTGGAHPNSNLSLYIFDRKTGQRLTLTDMVADTAALLGVVEKAFRQQQGLGPQYNLEERGFFLRDGRFFLPANVGMGRNGLLVYYNPYEIAAYAVGPIEVSVPYEQLNGILRDEWR